MHKCISRTKHRLSYVCFFAALAICLFGAIGQQRVVILIGALCLIAAAIMLLVVNCCPYCGESFRGLYWSQSAGFCRKCGKRIEFDDEQ